MSPAWAWAAQTQCRAATCTHSAIRRRNLRQSDRLQSQSARRLEQSGNKHPAYRAMVLRSRSARALQFPPQNLPCFCLAALTMYCEPHCWQTAGTRFSITGLIRSAKWRECHCLPAIDPCHLAAASCAFGRFSRARVVASAPCRMPKCSRSGMHSRLSSKLFERSLSM